MGCDYILRSLILLVHFWVSLPVGLFEQKTWDMFMTCALAIGGAHSVHIPALCAARNKSEQLEEVER